MIETIMPCLVDSNGNPREEGIIIGRLLAGYGELELEMCQCISATGMDIDTAIRLIFGNRGAERRIKESKKAVRDKYVAAGLGAYFAETFDDMDYCRELRNQFAHCHFYAWNGSGIQFVNLEDVALQSGLIRKFSNATEQVSISILRDQEVFFKYVQRCFWGLTADYYRSVGLIATHDPGRPAKMLRPKKHN